MRGAESGPRGACICSGAALGPLGGALDKNATRKKKNQDCISGRSLSPGNGEVSKTGPFKIVAHQRDLP